MRMRRKAPRSRVGSPATATRSAKSPARTSPTRSLWSRIAAFPEVAAISTCHRRHTRRGQQFHFARIVAVREDADITANADRNACRACHRQRLPACRHPGGHWFRAVPTRIASRCSGGGECRAISDPFDLHAREDFGRATIAVFDRVRARRHCAAHALRGGGMDRDRASGIVRRGDRRRHFRGARRSRGSVRPAASDNRRRASQRPRPPRSAGAPPLRRRRCRWPPPHPAALPRQARNPLAHRHPPRRSRASRRSCRGPSTMPCVDRLLQPDIGIACALGAEVALAW